MPRAAPGRAVDAAGRYQTLILDPVDQHGVDAEVDHEQFRAGRAERDHVRMGGRLPGLVGPGTFVLHQVEPLPDAAGLFLQAEQATDPPE